MDFADAFKQVITGNARITRTCWNDETRYVFLHRCRHDSDIRVNRGDGSISYLPTLDDMLAKDWELFRGRPASSKPVAA